MTSAGLTLRSLAVLLALCGTAGATHPVHHTLMELQYRPTKRRLELAVSLPSTELVAALEKRAGKEVDLLTESGKRSMIRYVRDKIRILRGRKRIRLEVVGHELGERTSWIYLEAKGVDSLRSLVLEHDALFELEDAMFFHVVEQREGKRRNSETLSHSQRRLALDRRR